MKFFNLSLRVTSLVLHNYRCFKKADFQFPNESFIILDENGSGKTTVLSALFTILTGRSFPGTKFLDNLNQGSQYFGINTEFADWYFSGQIGPNGRLNNKYFKPQQNIVFFDKSLDYKENWPQILTYQPIDNYWLFESRKKKLDILDELLVQIYGEDYEKFIRDLNRVCSSKQKLLKHCIDCGQSVDNLLLNSINKELIRLSNLIWKTRNDFFILLQKELPKFGEWINSPLFQWKVRWFKTNQFGEKIEIGLQSSDPYENQIAESLWSKELIIGKLLFGAQRDEFWIESNHLHAENVLSRGEMRLLILFIKGMIFSPNLNFNKQTWWFLDDIFNEFDTKREEVLFQEVLKKADLLICTSTKSVELDIATYSLKELTKSLN